MNNIDELLLGLLTIAAPVITVVALIQVQAAWRKPRIRFLTTTAVLSVVIALLVDAYVLAVANKLIGSPVAPDVVRILFRLILLALSLYPVWWLWLYLTGRFADGAQS